MVFNFSEKDPITKLALSRDLKNGVCLRRFAEAFHSFGNFQKMFWAGVSFYSNLVDSFSKAAYY